MAVSRWKSRLKPKTFKDYSYWFGRFLRDIRSTPLGGLSPDELVNHQAEHKDFEILDMLQGWVVGLPLSVHSKRDAYSSVKSFFMHNRAPLPPDPSFQVKSEVVRVVGDLSVEDFRKVLLASNVLYRAVFLCMFQGSMGLGELVFWSDNGHDSLMAQLEARKIPVKVDLPGRKRGRNVKPYYTFIGKDAVDALRLWLEKRRGNGSIFINQYGKPVAKESIWDYWMTRLRRLGLVPKSTGKRSYRSGKNPHEVRDLFRTRWQKSGADALAGEFFMGHVVDPYGYNKAFSDVNYSLEQYLKAEPWLNVLSEDPEKVPQVEVDRRISELTKMQDERLEAISRRLELLEEKRRP